MKKITSTLLLITLMLSGCYYDNQSEIHPNAVPCDTSNIAYTKVAAIMQNNCIGCHSGSQPSARISLDTYEGVKAAAVSGKLVGSIERSSGFRPMPPSGPLSPCDVTIIKSWVTDGTPNN